MSLFLIDPGALELVIGAYLKQTTRGGCDWCSKAYESGRTKEVTSVILFEGLLLCKQLQLRMTSSGRLIQAMGGFEVTYSMYENVPSWTRADHGRHETGEAYGMRVSASKGLRDYETTDGFEEMQPSFVIAGTRRCIKRGKTTTR